MCLTWHPHTSRSTYGVLAPFLLMMLLLQPSWYALTLTLLILNLDTFLNRMAYIFIGFLPHVWLMGVWPPGLAGMTSHVHSLHSMHVPAP